ncbi:MAG: helix-turn-helix domain-containing protein [Armatimonas sp.]
MEDTFVLDTPERHKAVSHPLRLAILRLLLDEEKTNEELATELGVASGKLYFHTKKLLDVGMITLVGTRQKGSVTEKLYRATARGFTQPPGDGVKEPKSMAILREGLALYQATFEEIGEPRSISGHWSGYHTPENEREFRRLMLALIEEFQERTVPHGTPNARALSITVLLHALENK